MNVESNLLYGMKLLYIMLLKFPGWMHSLSLMRGGEELEENNSKAKHEI